MISALLMLLVPSVAAGRAAISVAQTQAQPAVVESRGVWVDKAQMLEGRDKLLARLDRLKDAGFNVVYLATQVRGTVMYSASAVLPHYAEARSKDPQLLDWLIPAIHERGLRVEAWTEFGFYAYWTPDAAKDNSRGAILDQRPHLAAVDVTGKDYIHNEKWGDFYSLCPSNPESHNILIELYLEMLNCHKFDGLHLDRIRYATGQFCFCDYCKTRFRRDTGLELAAFPDGSSAHEVLVRWRKERLHEFMKRLSQRVHRHAPTARITSAVVPPSMIDEKGQDWPVWIEQGYLDAAIPMLYEKDITQDLRWIRERLGPDAPVFVGLDAAKGLSTLRQQIVQLRSQRIRGLTIWHAATVDPFLADLQRNAFAAPAVSPLYLDGQKKSTVAPQTPPATRPPGARGSMQSPLLNTCKRQPHPSCLHANHWTTIQMAMPSGITSPPSTRGSPDDEHSRLAWCHD